MSQAFIYFILLYQSIISPFDLIILCFTSIVLLICIYLLIHSLIFNPLKLIIQLKCTWVSPILRDMNNLPKVISPKESDAPSVFHRSFNRVEALESFSIVYGLVNILIFLRYYEGNYSCCDLMFVTDTSRIEVSMT